MAAIVDRQSAEREAVERTAARAAEVTARLNEAIRNLLRARGSVSADKARRAFVALYTALHLVELARSAPEILDVLARAVDEEFAAFKAAGRGVEPIEAVERAARELERRAGGNPTT